MSGPAWSQCASRRFPERFSTGLDFGGGQARPGCLGSGYARPPLRHATARCRQSPAFDAERGAGGRPHHPRRTRGGAPADESHTRVRPLSVVSDTHTHVPTLGRGGADHAETAAPALPQPGRHASRPADPGVARLLAERMPDTMRGRVRLTPAQLTIVALVVAVGLALAAWWAIRSGSTGEPVPAAAPGGSAVAGLETPGTTSAPGSAPPGTRPSVLPPRRSLSTSWVRSETLGLWCSRPGRA